MFAHCLLPALLLLASTSVAQYLPPYTTTEDIGVKIRPSHFRKETFFMPPGKCIRLINLKYESMLRCVWLGDPNGQTSAHWMNVTVWDQQPSPDINFLNYEVIENTILLITRSLPCAGRAIIKVDVGCEHTFEPETNPPSRNNLHPAPYSNDDVGEYNY